MTSDFAGVGPDADPQPSFAWDGSPAGTACPRTGETAPPQPPRRRLRARLIAAAAVVAFGAVLAVVLSSGGGSAATSRVVLAADTTTREQGLKCTFVINASANGKEVTLNGSGAFNTSPLSGSMELSGPGTSVQELFTGDAYYLQLPTQPGRWFKVDASHLFGSMGSDTSSLSLTSADPTQSLEMLRAAGTVTDEGSEIVAGFSTTHYHVVIDLSRVASLAPAAEQANVQRAVAAMQQEVGTTSLPMDVWIDSSNLVRQLQMSLTVPSKLGTVSEALTMTITAYGAQPPVSAPPAGEVTDISSVVGLGSSPPVPERGSTPPPATGSAGTGTGSD